MLDILETLIDAVDFALHWKLYMYAIAIALVLFGAFKLISSY